MGSKTETRDLAQILKDVFGFETFRGEQRRAVDLTLAGKNSLVLMPTGMGKSLCFQLPARILGGLTIVISPLIALMKDQVDAARKKGLKASFINSSLSREDRDKRLRQVESGEIELLYVTPERFRKAEFTAVVATQKISLMAIDEAHCISQWGHDFRPDYSRISEIREKLSRPPMMALTATATERVQRDIIVQMGLKPEEIETLAGGMKRENLAFSVLDPYGMDQKIQAFVALRHQHPGPAIVYFSLIQTLQKFSSEIARLGFPHVTYHGNLPDRARRDNQNAFLGGDTDLILATPAFGLGIDKPDVRLIVHGETPGSIEAYYQEAGRAGRDGQPADCVLLYDRDDVSIQSEFVKWTHPDASFVKTVFHLIERNPLRWKQEKFDFLREQMNFYNRRDFRGETAVNQLERWGCLEEQEGTLVPVEAPTDDLPGMKSVAEREKSSQARLLSMVQWAETESCRRQLIYEYFGLKDSQVCGVCDRCRGTLASV